jgi:site-specific DNA recombinase
VTHTPKTSGTSPVVRCAIYTRKSTEEGLEQQFNTLNAQRESAEAYIASQKHDGWTCIPDHFDDGGYTGGNMDRPAMQRLIADIEAGKIDAVVVYKVDRLSRSLLDFARLMSVFEKHRVAFVSTTQQFSTATSMGRLVLNVLLSFAQFEREIISERTRDKLAATRKKGKWIGGHPLLGYDLDRERSKLVVNDDEAIQVRAIFELYLQHQSLLPVVRELYQRDWRCKTWTTKAGKERGGAEFDRTSLHRLLTSVLYTGQVPYKGQLYPGEHEGIVDAKVFERVQQILKGNARFGGSAVRNKHGALLKGLLHCGPCGCAMTPGHSSKKDGRKYRYYTCVQSQKRGKDVCPSRTVPAEQIEQFVINQIRKVGQNPALVRQTLIEARRQSDARLVELNADLRRLERDLARFHAQVRNLANPGRGGAGARSAPQLAESQEQIAKAERQIDELDAQVAVIQRERIDESDAAATLAAFDPLWETLTPRERTRVVQLLVERADYDGSRGKLKITFSPAGIRALTNELAEQPREKIA